MKRAARPSPRVDRHGARRGRAPSGMPSAEQLRRLTADMVDAERPQKHVPEELTHAEVEELLAWYASDERAGKNVHKLYPAVEHHLKNCPRCARSYSLLQVALEDSFAGQEDKVRYPASSLRFLTPPPHVPWHQERASQLLGANSRVSILWNPTYLKSVFAPNAVPMMRGESDSDQILLLDDELMLGDQRAHVQAWISWHPKDVDRVNVRVLVVSPEPLPERLHLRLRWGDWELVGNVVEGQALFENLASPDFSRRGEDKPSRDFSLTLEVAPAEGDSSGGL